MKLESKSKPFPWRCPKCLEKAVEPVRIPYSTKRMVDGQVFVVEIPSLQIPKCAKCGELLFTESVHEQIEAAYRQQQIAVAAK